MFNLFGSIVSSFNLEGKKKERKNLISHSFKRKTKITFSSLSYGTING